MTMARLVAARILQNSMQLKNPAGEKVKMEWFKYIRLKTDPLTALGNKMYLD